MTDVKFNEYPQALIPPKGSVYIGAFERVVLGPEYDFGQGPTRPLIAIFITESGTGLTAVKDGVEYDIAPGEEVALWLIHVVLADRMKELKPTKGERVAVRYDGERLKKGMEPGDKNSTYHGWHVVMPDRPSEIVEVSWDD